MRVWVFASTRPLSPYEGRLNRSSPYPIRGSGSSAAGPGRNVPAYQEVALFDSHSGVRLRSGDSQTSNCQPSRCLGISRVARVREPSLVSSFTRRTQRSRDTRVRCYGRLRANVPASLRFILCPSPTPTRRSRHPTLLGWGPIPSRIPGLHRIHRGGPASNCALAAAKSVAARVGLLA